MHETHRENVYREILPESETTLQSTEDFKKRFREINIEKDEILVSFDVENLYPSIDKEEIVQFVNNKIKEKYGNDKTAEILIRTSNSVINESYFVINGKFYKQMKGVPMGSPISGLLAEMKLRIMERKLHIN